MSTRRPDSLRIWMERASGESEEAITTVLMPMMRAVRVVRRRRSVIIARFWTSSIDQMRWAIVGMKVCGAWARSVGVKVGEDVGSKLVTSLLTSFTD